MSLHVSTRDLKGRLTLGESTDKFRTWLTDWIDQGRRKVLLNLGEVDFIDSSGLGELVRSYTTLANQGGKLKLLKLQAKVHDLMQITKLVTVFEVYDNEMAAVLSFE
jgi:anti-sigma B factor antagonist